MISYEAKQRHYTVINQCLQLLTRSNLPAIMKLRVELQLLQIKKLLLNDALLNEVMCGSCGEDLFEGLLNKMRMISLGNGKTDALADLMDTVGGILSLLGSNSAAAEASQASQTREDPLDSARREQQKSGALCGGLLPNALTKSSAASMVIKRLFKASTHKS
jgi:hypothetical protein